MTKLSVAIATYNEEENIGRCLESLKGLAQEIVVVDGSSIDKTVEIAKKFGTKVFITDNPPIFHINKQKAIDACSGDWILQLDADEVVPENLAKEILNITKSGSWFNAFWLRRKNYFLGRWLTKGGQYPDPVIRFFKKGKAHLPCKSVHEQMVVEGEIGWLKNDLLHWATPKFSRYFLRENRYATLEADEMLKRRLPVNPLTGIIYLILLPIRTFLLIFIRHKGFMDGWPGFVFAFFSGFHHAWAFSKYCRMKFSPKKININREWK